MRGDSTAWQKLSQELLALTAAPEAPESFAPLLLALRDKELPRQAARRLRLLLGEAPILDHSSSEEGVEETLVEDLRSLTVEWQELVKPLQELPELFERAGAATGPAQAQERLQDLLSRLRRLEQQAKYLDEALEPTVLPEDSRSYLRDSLAKERQALWGHLQEAVAAAALL